MYKDDFALNNLEWLMSHKTKPNKIPYESQQNKINERNRLLAEKKFIF